MRFSWNCGRPGERSKLWDLSLDFRRQQVCAHLIIFPSPYHVMPVFLFPGSYGLVELVGLSCVVTLFSSNSYGTYIVLLIFVRVSL